MAQKIDRDLLDDTRKEHRKQSAGALEAGKSNGAVSPPAAEPAKTEPLKTESSKIEVPPVDKTSPPDPKPADAPGASQSSPSTGQSVPPPGPDTQAGQSATDDEFKQKFDEYFKDAPITGEVVVSLVDDLKSNLLMIYAKKSGLDMPKEAFVMDTKSKGLTVFLVDYAVKNKLFGFIQKYPLAAAGCVVGISAASTWLMIEMMKKGKSENEALKKEVENLRREKQAREQQEQRARASATQRKDVTDVQDLNETPSPADQVKEAGTGVQEFIKTLT